MRSRLVLVLLALTLALSALVPAAGAVAIQPANDGGGSGGGCGWVKIGQSCVYVTYSWFCHDVWYNSCTGEIKG
jgi:hypothetical protein